MAHPEEPAAADAGAADIASNNEDEAVKKQLMASLGTNEVPKLEVLPPCLRGACALHDPHISVALHKLFALHCMQDSFLLHKRSFCGPLSGATHEHAVWLTMRHSICKVSSQFVQAMLDESAETPSIQQLVDGSVATVAQMPAAAFPLADMLVSLCGQDSGKNKQQVFKGLVQHLTELGSVQVKFLLLLSLPGHHTCMCIKRLETLHIEIKPGLSKAIKLQVHHVMWITLFRASRAITSFGASPDIICILSVPIYHVQPGIDSHNCTVYTLT